MFEHPDASASWISIEIVEEVERVLMVETTLVLWPNSREYDESRVTSLITSAHAFASDRHNGIDKVRIVAKGGKF
jgi:hypothetical protein